MAEILEFKTQELGRRFWSGQLIFEDAGFGMDGQFFAGEGFHMADDFCLDMKGL